MNAVYDFYLALMNWYTPDRSLAVIKLACVACSCADIFFILVLLRTVHALEPNAPRPVWRTRTMYLFAALTPTLVLPGRNSFLFLWQSFILGAPYLILAHLVITKARLILDHLRAKIEPKLDRR